MKKHVLVALLLGTMIMAATALKIDNFDDGDLKAEPAWWTFGASEQIVVAPDMFFNDPLKKYMGKGVLRIAGATKSWYIGGMGTYLGKDASAFTHLKLYVHGNGPKSGKINIQLFDDDNWNHKLEQDAENNYEPVFDDKFEYTLNVNWKGWRVLHLPIDQFKDVNLNIGDNTWNPTTENESGGLLHFQFIFLAASKTGNIEVYMDNIKLVKLEKKEAE